MTSKSKITKYWPFFPTDFAVAREYLKDQAGRGYFIESVNQKFMKATYVKDRPAKAYYYIDCFMANEKEAMEAHDRELFAKGWRYVCGWGDSKILKAAPGTEAEEMLMPRDFIMDEKCYRKALTRSQTLPAFLLSVLFVLISYIMADKQPLLYNGNPVQQGIAVAFSMMMVFTVVILFQCLYNAGKSRGRQRDGQEPRLATAGRSMSRTRWYLIGAAADVIAIIAFIIAGGLI